MYQRHELGKMGEEISCNYLENKGFEILARNFRFKKYEIDIIAKDKNELVFVEVKTRSGKRYGMPAESVTSIKQNHIYKAAKFYLHIHKKENYFVRFDVVEVLFSKNKYKINHIKQIM